MFLNQLKKENKELFLKVCVQAAMANDVFENEEKEMIVAYCKEMDISENISDNIEDFDTILERLAFQTSNMEKNIIVLEILGLLKSDGLFDEQERRFMESLMKKLKIKEDVLSKYENLIERYTEIYQEMYTAICE